MKNKKSNKRVFLIILLLFIMLGFAGYGVYSYFWTEGNYNGADTIRITPFNPETIIDSNSNFLGDGGDVILSCPNVTGNETITCTGEITVKNNADSSINVEILNASSSSFNERNGMRLYPSNPNFGWTSTTLSPGEERDLSISVSTQVSAGDYGSDSGVQVYDEFVSSSETPAEATRGDVQVSFSLKATQVHD